MGAGLLILFIVIVIVVAIALAAGIPTVLAYLSDRQEDWRSKYIAKRDQERIGRTALREIVRNNGDGAGLIAEIALEEIERAEMKELS